MKKSMFTFAASMFVAASILSGCSSPDKKVENAEKKVTDAKADVKDAKQDLGQAQRAQEGEPVNDFQQFKTESYNEIRENDRHIVDLRIDIKTEHREAREKDERKIDALEKDNHQMK